MESQRDEEDVPPSPKRARLEPDTSDLTDAFSRRPASGASSGGGWTLRNWTQEKEAARTPSPAEEEDWSFFQQQPQQKKDSSSSPPVSGSPASAAPSPPTFKVPQPRTAKHPKRVSFSEEVTTISYEVAYSSLPKSSDFFDADGNPLMADTTLASPSVPVVAAEAGEEEVGRGDAPLQLSRSKEGVESLIKYLVSSVPTSGTGKPSKPTKYFVKAKGGEKTTTTQQQLPTAKPSVPLVEREDLDEDSFLEAFIDSDYSAPPPATECKPLPQNKRSFKFYPPSPDCAFCPLYSLVKITLLSTWFIMINAAQHAMNVVFSVTGRRGELGPVQFGPAGWS